MNQLILNIISKMSFSLFKSQISALTGRQHVSRIQFAETIAKAYNGLVTRAFETVTGGGKVVAPITGLPGLIAGIYSITEQNLHQHNEVNFFSQIAPYFKMYWVGKQIIGPTGFVVINNTGQYKGPMIKQHFNFEIWVNIFVACCATHIMTLSGTYTTYAWGVTTPWSGALLVSLP